MIDLTQKKDWPEHKTMCKMFKTSMEHVASWNLHDFPFSFYPAKGYLCSYNVVNFLIAKSIHNIGLFKRLCGCYNEVGFGEFGAKMIADFQQSKPTPEDMFAKTGLSPDFFPLSKPFPEGTDISKIDCWKTYMEAREYSMDDAAPLILEVPLTIFHIVNKFFDKSKKEKDQNKITIHLIGVEKEADLIFLFECLLPLFPKMQICIHMIGPKISENISMTHRAMLLSSMSNQSSIFVSLTTGMYSPEHYDGSFFNLGDSIPAEIIESQNFGQGKPDMIIALNAHLIATPEWGTSLKFLMDLDETIYVTEQIEQFGIGAGHVIPQVGGRLGDPIEANPFRQPVFEFKRDANFPGWSNGFLFSLKKAQ